MTLLLLLSAPTKTYSRKLWIAVVWALVFEAIHRARLCGPAPCLEVPVSDKYVLDPAGNAAPEPDLLTWARWFETADRRVASTKTADGRVSTVFLGLDHSFSDGPPVLWETMIFGGPHDQHQKRYMSREDAVAGHERAVQLAGDAS